MCELIIYSGLIFSLLKFYFSLFLGTVIYDNEFEKENEILGKIEQQHIFLTYSQTRSSVPVANKLMNSLMEK